MGGENVNCGEITCVTKIDISKAIKTINQMDVFSKSEEYSKTAISTIRLLRTAKPVLPVK
jgi:ADP-dependent phosphofructokinase/glucokinase